jgi:hypothetical protein
LTAYSPRQRTRTRAESTGIGGTNDVPQNQAETCDPLIENLPRSPWPDLKDADGKELEGPFVFLVPQARFKFASAEGQQIATDRRAVLAIELRPYVDDGKHWVLYTDGTCQREAIRQDLVTARPAGAGD